MTRTSQSVIPKTISKPLMTDSWRSDSKELTPKSALLDRAGGNRLEPQLSLEDSVLTTRNYPHRLTRETVK